jgi:hypothetical protein
LPFNADLIKQPKKYFFYLQSLQQGIHLSANNFSADSHTEKALHNYKNDQAKPKNSEIHPPPQPVHNLTGNAAQC